jgi:hypothetical protein
MQDELSVSMSTQVIDDQLMIDLVDTIEPCHDETYHLLRKKLKGASLRISVL